MRSAFFLSTTSPSFARTESSFTTTFPPSIAALTPIICISPTTGPGANEVSPAGITISLFNVVPSFAGAVALLLFRIFESMKGFSEETRIAGIPFKYSTRPLLSVCSRARRRALFLAILTTAFPRSACFICKNCFEGKFKISTTATTEFSLIRLTSSLTRSTFC